MLLNKEAKKLAQDALRPMKYAMGLGEWRVTVIYDSLNGQMGSICPDPSRRRATMKLDLQDHVDKNDLLDTIRHELLHLMHFQFEVYRKMLYQFITKPEEYAADQIWDDAIESLVFHLETMLDACGLTSKRILNRGIKMQTVKVKEL